MIRYAPLLAVLHLFPAAAMGVEIVGEAPVGIDATLAALEAEYGTDSAATHEVARVTVEEGGYAVHLRPNRALTTPAAAASLCPDHASPVWGTLDGRGLKVVLQPQPGGLIRKATCGAP